MSKLSTYARSKSNTWYRDPVLGLPDWDLFICFDDDDPIELVIADHEGLTARQAIALLGLTRTKAISRPHYSSRMFGDTFKAAAAYWLRMEVPFSDHLVREHDGIITEEPFQGVFYPFDRRWKGEF